MNAPKLQLEAGKYYRTRDGDKVFVAALNLFDDASDHPVAVIIGNNDDEDDLQWYSPEGRLNAYSFSPKGSDIVSEWVEPKRIKGWVNLYDKACFNQKLVDVGVASVGHAVHPSQDDALRRAHACEAQYGIKLLACIEVDVLEGQGRDGEAGR